MEPAPRPEASTSRPRRLRPGAAALALALLLPCSWATAALSTALVANPPMLAPLAPAAATAFSTAEPAWWQGFRDPVLERLVPPARDEPTRAVAIVTAWVAAQVFHAQAAISTEIARAAQREQTLVMNAEAEVPQRDALLAELAARIEQAEAATDDRLARRNGQLERLAEVAGIAPPALAELVQPRLAELSLPQFAAAVPQANSEQAAAPELVQLVEHERRTVLAVQVASTRQQEYQALRSRQQLGAESEVAVLESYQRLMNQGRLVAAASGDLAIAWLRLMQGQGGRLSQASAD